MDITVRIPNFRKANLEHEKSFTVFCIEVNQGERTQTVERRYTDFEELHKKLRRSISTPAFPPKTVLKWNQKVLEARRNGFEVYLQSILKSSKVPRSLFKFLELSINGYSGSMDSLDKLSEPGVTHQAILAFSENSYLHEQQKGSLPDILVTGVTHGLYGSADDIR